MSHDAPVVLTSPGFVADTVALLKTLHVSEEGEDADRVRELARAAESIARPKALYRPADVQSRGDDFVIIEGVTFKSRVLRVNLDPVHRVFPYVATCGTELEEWSRSLGGMLESFWADGIKRLALTAARETLNTHLAERYGLTRAATMNPGSLPDWPLDQQRPLFALMGDTKKTIGVELTDSLLMLPTKTVSGIRFATEITYENCQLCPREECPGRRASYDPGLYERKYRQPGR